MNKVVKIDPIQLYLDWLKDIPVIHAEYIAYIFWVLTTQNTADLALTRKEALRSFKSHILGQDFPVRVVSRMLTVKEHTNLIVNNSNVFLARDRVSEMFEGKVLFLSEKQWEKTLYSWNSLYSGYLSQEIFFKWIRTVF